MSGGEAFVPRRFVVAEFADSDAMLDGTTKLRERGYKRLDTHTPYPVHGIEKALGLGRPKIPAIVLCAALTGVCAAYSMMYYMNVVDWPINVANRPPNSVPAFIPIMFELAVLFGGGASFFGVLALMKFPQPYHPVFQWDRFVDHASTDGFFVSVELDAHENADAVAADVRAVGAKSLEIITEVER